MLNISAIGADSYSAIESLTRLDHPPHGYIGDAERIAVATVGWVALGVGECGRAASWVSLSEQSQM